MEPDEALLLIDFNKLKAKGTYDNKNRYIGLQLPCEYYFDIQEWTKSNRLGAEMVIHLKLRKAQELKSLAEEEI